MEADPMETVNVIDKFPDVAARLKGYAEEHSREFYSPLKVELPTPVLAGRTGCAAFAAL